MSPLSSSRRTRARHGEGERFTARASSTFERRASSCSRSRMFWSVASSGSVGMILNLCGRPRQIMLRKRQIRQVFRKHMLRPADYHRRFRRHPAGPPMSQLYEVAPWAFWRVTPPDLDPVETREWLEAFDALVEAEGPDRATFLLKRLLDRARAKRVKLPPVFNTAYKNTVALEDQPQFPGNLEVEQRLASIIRWNALAMVVRANREHAELGGHIASYASAADLFEVAFNHFFRAGLGGDLVYFQPHSAPGVYARAFLEGRLSEEHLEHYRREVGGKGLSSYCHPWLMPDFWQFPTGSMGLGPINA